MGNFKFFEIQLIDFHLGKERGSDVKGLTGDVGMSSLVPELLSTDYYFTNRSSSRTAWHPGIHAKHDTPWFLRDIYRTSIAPIIRTRQISTAEGPVYPCFTFYRWDEFDARG